MCWVCPVCGMSTFCLRLLGVNERVCPECVVWFHETLAGMVRSYWLEGKG